MESFDSTFGPKAQRKRPTVKAGDMQVWWLTNLVPTFQCFLVHIESFKIVQRTLHQETQLAAMKLSPLCEGIAMLASPVDFGDSSSAAD